MTSALEVAGLSVSTLQGVRLVQDVSFIARSGACTGIVGESGAGKSMLCAGILGLAQREGLIVDGTVRLDGKVISGSEGRRALSSARGSDVAIVFQEPSVSLNPSMTVGAQIASVVRRHLRVGRRDGWNRAVECLDLAGVPDAARRAKAYPHTLSGGLRQRAMIAMAISCSPSFLIADEATTALDVTVQRQVLALLRQLQSDLGLGLLVITHDLGVVADVCDNVLVMYGGQVVEAAAVDNLFHRPQHPYTQGLLDAVPSLRTRAAVVTGIPGTVPHPAAELPGCRFAPRCGFTTPQCEAERPSLVEAHASQTRCLRADHLRLPGIGVR